MTTGRPRRCGWFDAVIARYATRVNGITDYFLTKLDVLSSLETVPICVGYDVDGKRTDEMPMTQTDIAPRRADLRGDARLVGGHLRRPRATTCPPTRSRTCCAWRSSRAAHRASVSARAATRRSCSTTCSSDHPKGLAHGCEGGQLGTGPAAGLCDLTALLQPLFLENFACSTSLIAQDDAGIMTGLPLKFPSVDDPSAAYVHFVGVHPAYRRRGLGRALHDSFASSMRIHGIGTVRCVTAPVNTDSITFHERLGFEVEYRDDAYVHFVRTGAAAQQAVPLSAPDGTDGKSTPPQPTISPFVPHCGTNGLGGAGMGPDSSFVPLRDARPDDAAWAEALWPVPADTVLVGGSVTLSIANPVNDARELFAALDDDEVWAHVRGRPATPHALQETLEGADASGRLPWIVRLDGRVVGTTSYLEVSPVDARLEIGYTLYARSAWGTTVNPECKLLLMDWAFAHGYGRVQLKTDIRNTRSQRAIARLGATYEGVLRRYQRRQDGSIRDTVLFSVAAEDWPRVRAGLHTRLR